MANAHLKLVTPAAVKRTVTPRRPPNSDIRTREYLTDGALHRAIAVAVQGFLAGLSYSDVAQARAGPIHSSRLRKR